MLCSQLFSCKIWAKWENFWQCPKLWTLITCQNGKGLSQTFDIILSINVTISWLNSDRMKRVLWGLGSYRLRDTQTWIHDVYIYLVYTYHRWRQFQAGWAGSCRLSTLSRLHCYLVFILKYNRNIFIWRRIQDKKVVFLKKKLDIQVLLKIIDTYT